MRVAVVGAGGAVGREMLDLLARGELGVAAGDLELHAYASPASRGRELPFADGTVECRALEEPIATYDVALFAAGGAIARQWAQRFAAAGARVVDNSSAFRLDPQVPLVVPEINAGRVPAGGGIVANPNCSTIILLLPVAPLLALGHARIVAATYQAVSGAGRAGLEALVSERAGGAFRPGVPFPFPIEGNLFPLIGDFDDDGVTAEERKMVLESRKILEEPQLELHVTCVRVPVERCHSEAVTMLFDEDVELDAARRLLSAAPGVELVDDPAELPTPRNHAGRHTVAVGRLRAPTSRAIQVWVVGDQLLKGAALNATQIARHWLRRP